MTVRVTPLGPEDLLDFQPQAGQWGELPAQWPALVLAAGQLGPAGAFRAGNTVVALAGCLEDEWGWQGWALLSEEAGPHLLALTRALKWFVGYFKNSSPERPLTAHLRRDWPAAQRWGRLLGFRPTGNLVGGLFGLWVAETEPGSEDDQGVGEPAPLPANSRLRASARKINNQGRFSVPPPV